VFLLPHSEDRMILSSFVWIGYQRMRDGRNCRSYSSALHCKQCGRAVKHLSSKSIWLILAWKLKF